MKPSNVAVPPTPPTVEEGIKALQEVRNRKANLEKEEADLARALKQRAEEQQRELQELGVQLQALAESDNAGWGLWGRLSANWQRNLEQKPGTAPFQTLEEGIKKLREVKAKKQTVRQEEEQAFNTLNRRLKDQDQELEKLGVRPGDGE